MPNRLAEVLPHPGGKYELLAEPLIPPYPEEICGPRGVKVNECCADEVEAFGDAMIEDGFEDGDPGVWVE